MSRGWQRLAAAVVVLSGLASGAWSAEGGGKYLIRWKQREGQRLRYSLGVAGGGSWAPRREGLSWGTLETLFVFGLRGKALRERGACTYELLAERLRSRLEGPKGVVEVRATPRSWDVDAGKLDLEGRRGNPLAREMTLTVGERGAVRYGTGLRPLAPFFVAHVDPRFWTVLTLAPAQEVGVGDEWDVDFEARIPDSRGELLSVKGRAQVKGWERCGGRRCLAIVMACRLELKDTWVLLRNGDRVRVDEGTYWAQGKALWDVERGLLCSAEARNGLKIVCDKPERRGWSGEARSTLKLLDAD
jgi:hypothetical protein